MSSLLTLLLLGQLVTAPPPAAPAAPTTWGAPVTWLERGQPRRAWLNPVLVAEPAPSAEGAAAVRAAAPEAQVVLERPTMRLWRVTDAAVVRAARPALLPVLHDLPSAASPLRVPVGVVCRGERLPLAGLAALERARRDPGCLPDLWKKGVTR